MSTKVHETKTYSSDGVVIETTETTTKSLTVPDVPMSKKTEA